MNKDEMKKRMADFSAKMQEINSKVKDAADTAVLTGMEAKDIADKKMEDAKSDLIAAKEQYRIVSERAKSKVSSELLRAQMSIDAAKENIEQRKEAHDKEKLARYISDMLEYSEMAAALAVVAADESQVALLEALDAKAEYDAKYGAESTTETEPTEA